MNKRKQSFGLRAALLGWERSTAKVKVGAALVTRNQVVVACNKDRGAAKAARWYPYPENNTHAEWNLFSHTNADTKIKGVVYVARKLKDGTFGLARPCVSCRAYLKSLGIKKVVFTVSKDEVQEERL